jgi:hypothetical protein
MIRASSDWVTWVVLAEFDVQASSHGGKNLPGNRALGYAAAFPIERKSWNTAILAVLA